MLVKNFSWDDHGETYERWFKERQAEMPMREIMSPTGIVVYDNDIPVCMGFLCKTDSNASIMTNFISNINVDYKTRSECLDLMIDTLAAISEKEGFLILAAASPVRSICARLEKHGLFKTHENVTNYMKIQGDLCLG